MREPSLSNESDVVFEQQSDDTDELSREDFEGFDETNSIASTIIPEDCDFLDEESVDDHSLLPISSEENGGFSHIDALKNHLQERIGSQKNIFGLLPLGKAFFEDADFLSAFIIWQLECGVLPSQLIDSGLLQHFFVHQYVMLCDEEMRLENPLTKTYAILTEISKENDDLQELLMLAKKTFCGVRGLKFNQKSEDVFVSINLLYEEFVTEEAIPDERYSPHFSEMVSIYEPYDLPEFCYAKKNGFALYDIFGFSFLALLNFKKRLDEAVFMQIKAKDSAGMIDLFCDKMGSHELTVSQIRSFFPHITDLFASMSSDAFLTALAKNPLFLMCIVYQPLLLQRMPATIVKRQMANLLKRNDVYVDVFSLTKILLALQSFSSRYNASFMAEMKSRFFEAVFSSQEEDYVGLTDSLQLLSGKVFCQKKLNSWRDQLIAEVKKGASYEALHVMRNGFFMQGGMIIESVYPELLNDFPYLLDYNEYELPVFYIQTRWEQRENQPFLLKPLLDMCKPSSGFAILKVLVDRTTDESFLLASATHVLENKNQHLLIIEKICLKNSLAFNTVKHLFLQIKTLPLRESQRVSQVSFVRRPSVYSAAHVFLALKWIQAALDESYKKEIKRLLVSLFDLASEVIATDLKVFIHFLRNKFNELHAADKMPDLKIALIELVKHIERGDICLTDLVPQKNNEKRSRDKTTYDDEPPARKNCLGM